MVFGHPIQRLRTIAEKSQQILGDDLLGLQAGNEPDFYAMNGHRPSTYGPQDYANDVGNLIKAMEADYGIPCSYVQVWLLVLGHLNKYGILDSSTPIVLI